MDLDKVAIDINCPECEFYNSVTLGDVANGASIICVGCLKTIQLVDGNGDTTRATSEVNQAFNDLGRNLQHGH